MPSTQGMELLVRKNQLTDVEWFALLEARRSLVKPHLDTFTLPELGSLKCFRRELSFTHELRLDGPKVIGDERFSLKTQGIFRPQPWSAIERIPNSGYRPPPGGVACPDGTMQIWGLTRSGLWILAEVRFVGEDGYKERGYERAKTVEITEVNLPTIVSKTKEKPQRIWEELGKAIKEWVEFREGLYNQALNLARMVGIEELALSLIQK